MPDFSSRYHFLAMAVFFESSLMGVAGVLGWWFRVDPLARLHVDGRAALCGTAGAVPLFLLFLLSSRYPVGPLRRIKDLLLEMLGPSLGACRWYDLMLVAGIAGLSEELLFRGALQPLLGPVWSNVLFGLAHAVSLSYAVLAGAVGGYLAWLFSASDNLLTPIVTHALYDFLAFLVVAREWRRSSSEAPQGPSRP